MGRVLPFAPAPRADIRDTAEDRTSATFLREMTYTSSYTIVFGRKKAVFLQ
jgi:hypothetical protein